MSQKYIALSILFFSISFVGVLYLLRTRPVQISTISTTNPSPTSASTIIDQPSISPTLALADTPTAAPTPTDQELSTSVFSATYQSNYQLYQDKEMGSIDRYTLVGPDGSTITVHAGKKWSWVYPNRVYGEPKLSDHLAFTYEVDGQKIVDTEVGEVMLTIQCVHNGATSAITDCTNFLSSFKIK